MEAREIGFIIRSITANVNSYIEKQVAEYGLKQGQFEYFLIISMRPDINQLELAKLKGVGKASVTKALKILESQTLITRSTDPNDKRHIQCRVSEKGQLIVDKMMSIQSSVEAEVLKGFSKKDKEKFLSYLMTIHQNTSHLLERG